MADSLVDLIGLLGGLHCCGLATHLSFETTEPHLIVGIIIQATVLGFFLFLRVLDFLFSLSTRKDKNKLLRNLMVFSIPFNVIFETHGGLLFAQLSGLRTLALLGSLSTVAAAVVYE